MPKVTFLPVNIVCDAKEGDSILDIALDNDIPLQHACGGFCSCTTCHIHVKSGDSSLTGMEEEERELIASVDELMSESRLGCQARIKGSADVTVHMINVD